MLSTPSIGVDVFVGWGAGEGRGDGAGWADGTFIGTMADFTVMGFVLTGKIGDFVCAATDTGGGIGDRGFCASEGCNAFSLDIELTLSNDCSDVGGISTTVGVGVGAGEGPAPGVFALLPSFSFKAGLGGAGTLAGGTGGATIGGAAGFNGVIA